MRLQSFLSRAGVASRRSVVGELKAGKVKVNGEVVRVPSYPIFPQRDLITYLDRPVALKEKKYYLFYKPEGVISTAKDTHRRKTVLDFFKGEKERVYPVGRLDQDTTGLLLLTNDGDLANQLMHPRYGIKKVYEAVLNRAISGEEIKKLEHGVVLEGEKTAPCEIKKLTKSSKDVIPERLNRGSIDSRLKIAGMTEIVQVTLHEGRKRQIRLMFQSIGIKVLDLHRAFYGPLNLSGLRPGESRPLSASELQLLRKTLKTKGTGLHR